MKSSELIEEVDEEIEYELREKAIEILKSQKKKIEEAKKVFIKLNRQYNEMIEMDVRDLVESHRKGCIDGSNIKAGIIDASRIYNWDE